MARETVEIMAIWAERPSLFSSGLLRWVAVCGDQDNRQIVYKAPAFPLEERLVDEHHTKGDHPYIHPNLTTMDDAKRAVVEEMLADFVRFLERSGWVQSGQGADWFSLRFEREVSS